MTATEVRDRVDTASSGRPAPSAAAPTRRRRTRLSRGHALMLGAALVAVLGNLVLLRGGSERQVVQTLIGDVAVGQTLTAADLGTATVPVDAALTGLVTAPDEVVGTVLRNRLEAGQVLRTTDVTAAVAGDRDLRQLSVPLPAERAVGGNLQPDDRVDVITVDEDGASYLVADVRVVSVGTAGAGLGQVTASHVVLEVDADQALCLAAAMAGGDLDLVRATGQAPVTTTTCGGAR